ncbi:DUF6011 domain-containing protein [Streptomyces aidingensis]|uniref:Uncharacterized protein n=1 Tax=Streptomyces aidingensis TaxID=910347 RepID=A0A1I1Q5Z8_9ACTN|nr:DUF6011 domain-containing protein [Streptomyces aidingensis]SFD13540.1 hypothetical protein SAMN05421773_11064 [Streptomyces aidingensis]
MSSPAPEQQERPVCADCRRPLVDPASVAAGRGPVCAAKHHPAARAPQARRAAAVPGPGQTSLPIAAQTAITTLHINRSYL